MIAVWMLYCLGIGLAFVVVGYALERSLHFAGRPTRLAWVIALVGSYLVPVAAWVRPDAFATFAVPVPVEPSANSSSSTTATISTASQTPPSRSFSLSNLDLPLRWAWGIGSLAMLFALATATVRLVSLRRRWRPAAVDGRKVLVSPDIGPAVVGLWSPRVVLPEWALELPEHERELMLAHEEQHVHAGDPIVLAAALAAVLIAPWNLALWWQWRRLRLAVEIDCDARVLVSGRSAPAYGALLLRVGGRRSGQTLGVAAFGEPVSFLESRIRRMLATMPRWRWGGAAAAVIVAAGAIVGACEAPHPMSPTEPAAEAVLRSAAVARAASVVTESAVDERPDFLGGPQPLYPELLRRAGVTGSVVLQAIVDTTGHVERASIKVLASSNPGFDESAREALLRAKFRVGRVHGRAVRVLIQMGYGFSAPETAQDTLERPATKVSGELERARRHADFIRQLARLADPEAVAHPTTNQAIGMIVDAQYRVIALAVGVRKSTDQSCLDALKRLLPSFQNARFPTAGCMDADTQGKVALYWGQLATR